MTMPDLLIRNVDQSDVDKLDSKASRLGLSRSQYLSRLLHQEAGRASVAVTESDLDWFASTFADLGDEDVMGQAWS